MLPPSRLSLLLLAALLPAQQAAPTPDPLTVQRFGPAYRYTQDGWIVLHIEGKPYERGFQHGRLLAEELVAYMRTLGHHRARGSPEDGWKNERLLCNALFLRGYDPEYLEEMRGIADGGTAAGARIFGRALDVLDVAALNSATETMCLEDALGGLPTGLEGKAFVRPGEQKGDHCSAFAATGAATRDGKIVFGHITMFSLPCSVHFNVWLDVQPEQGHRVCMQTSAGGIWSGLDWYQNDAGILLTETTIGQTRFDRNGVPIASRARKAMQYSADIDTAVKLLAAGNNGLYTNEWLLADTKTDEIAMFELGTARTRLWRSSKDEWLGGTKGFYWGCNNERELELRLEQVPSLLDRPRDLSCHPSDRDCKWLALFDQWQGRIDLEFGKLAFTTPPLAAAHSLDAKVTTSVLAGKLQSVALFGPPRGSTWMPTKAELLQYPEITPLVNHDWTLLGPVPPAAATSRAVDLAYAKPKGDKSEDDDDDDKATPPPAWHGSLLPASDADLWLPIAFAAHERLVAAELACTADERAAERALQQFQLRARWQHALRSLGKDVPLLSLSTDLRRSEWYEVALGKGTLLLDQLRSAFGDDQYREYMDSFGRAHAGQKVPTSEFVAHMARPGLKDLAPLLQTWLRGEPSPGAPVWSITAFELEPEQSLIVYGTSKEAPANREAALLLQRRVASRWHNFDVPIKADVEVTDAELQGHHLVLVGRPCTNAVAERLRGEPRFAFPLLFHSDSFTVAGEGYAHARTAVIAAGPNPRNARFSLVLYAGLSSDSTREVVQQQPDDCEVQLFAHGRKPKALAVAGTARQASNASTGR